MLVKILFSSLFSFVVYILLVGSLGTDEIIIGIMIATVVGILTRGLLVQDEKKVMNVRGWVQFIWYAIVYFFIYETRAHWDVVKRTFTMKIRPGIVRVPFYTDSDYGTISVGNSITNTPGTVVVEIDEERRYFYVHWIFVPSADEQTCFKNIVEPFEKRVGRFL